MNCNMNRTEVLALIAECAPPPTPESRTSTQRAHSGVLSFNYSKQLSNCYSMRLEAFKRKCPVKKFHSTNDQTGKELTLVGIFIRKCHLLTPETQASG